MQQRRSTSGNAMEKDHRDQILLTIAIPTYNRAELLQVLLAELYLQIPFEEQVELIVSDNASTDMTPVLIDEFIQRGMKIRYIRNSENIGPDANFLQCYEQAMGEYVWIFGDDDILIEGGLKKLIPCLKTFEYDLIYVNSYSFDGKYVPLKNDDEVMRIKVYSDGRSFALRVHVFFTFISGNIFRKTRIEREPHQPFKDLINSNLIQLSWIFTLLSRNPKCLYVDNCLIASRAANSGGYGICNVFGLRLEAICKKYLSQNQDIVRAILNSTIQKWMPGVLYAVRNAAANTYEAENAREILRNSFYGNMRYWIFLYPVIRFPQPIAKVWLNLSRAFNRLDRTFGSISCR